MIEAGRDLWLLKQGHLQQVAQKNVQMASDYLQKGILHNLFVLMCVCSQYVIMRLV